MSIVLINRNSKAGFSIYKCFSEFKKVIDVKELFVPEYRISIKNMIKNIRYIKNNTNKDDVLHITGDIHYVLFGLHNRKTILTIHDTVMLDRSPKNFKWYFYYFIWFYFPCKIAKQIVCISEETQRRLNSYVKCKSIVIPDPVYSEFTTVDKPFSKECPVILHIGTGWNKNLTNLIKAVIGLPVKLVIVGRISEEDKQLLEINNINYENKMNLTDLEIVQEYIQCDILSFPTIYEGFGLPILEAQKTGRVVITSNLEPHKTVAGAKGAVFVDPYSVESISDGLKTIIQNEHLRESVIKNGLENIQQYSLNNIVDEYKKVYNSL